jgi:hypothetical protein
MLTEIHYRGYRIVWDARQTPGTLFWTGKAAVVPPEDVSGVKCVHRITGSDYFLSEDDARDHLVSAAKEWIENIDNRESLSLKYRKAHL